MLAAGRRPGVGPADRRRRRCARCATAGAGRLRVGRRDAAIAAPAASAAAARADRRWSCRRRRSSPPPVAAAAGGRAAAGRSGDRAAGRRPLLATAVGAAVLAISRAGVPVPSLLTASACTAVESRCRRAAARQPCRDEAGAVTWPASAAAGRP